MSSLMFYCLQLSISAIFEKRLTDGRTDRWSDGRAKMVFEKGHFWAPAACTEFVSTEFVRFTNNKLGLGSSGDESLGVVLFPAWNHHMIWVFEISL